MPHPPRIPTPHHTGANAATQAVAARMPLRRLVYRYWFFGWLFEDVNRKGLFERAAAWRHNQEQARWLPTILRAEQLFCQLFSEPEAGSDLAGVRSRAECLADGWHIDGQKVWTSNGTFADLGLALVRTNREAPKHRGLTMFLVPLKQDGVEDSYEQSMTYMEATAGQSVDAPGTTRERRSAYVTEGPRMVEFLVKNGIKLQRVGWWPDYYDDEPGGSAESRTVIAEIFNAEIAPHLYAGPIEAAANIQYGTSLPNFLILESIETFGGFYAKLLNKPIRWEQGYVIPPTDPGLGSDLNEEVALAHPYAGDKLHLEMTNTVVQ